MAEDSVADDILRNGFERWQRLEGEKQAISDDLKELFAELKGQGFDGKALRAAFRDVAKVDDADVQEHNAVVDLYVNSLLRGRAAKVGTVPATRSRAAREAETEDRNDALAALRADPAMSIVDVSNLKNKSSNAQTIPAAAEAQRSTPVDDVGSSGEARNQSVPQTGSDLAAPEPIGQVAPHSEPRHDGHTSPAQMPVDPAVAGSPAAVSVATSPDRVEGIEDGQPVQVADKSARASAPAAPAAPMYAEPGVETWETNPPEGVDRGPVSIAFSNMGQDPVLIRDELESRRAQPIIKVGKVIIDGWARYMIARDMFEEVLDDGVTKRVPVPYAVMQYDGEDALIDAIRWNVDGRSLTEQQKRIIAQKLASQQEFKNRKDDIYKAFEIYLEPV